MAASGTFTPMVQQYREVKDQHPEELLFFRLGDFYELFFDDALTASRELGLTLTGRAGGLEERIPMCGVPFHSVDGYIAKLIRKGYRIAICEQMEDPRLAKGLVKRDVIKIITPGTVLSDQVLEDGHNQYLACLKEEEDTICLSVADVSTGECSWYLTAGSGKKENLLNEILKLAPAELIGMGSISVWDGLVSTLETRLPACVVSKYVPELNNDYFALHFGADGEGGNVPIVRSTVEGMLSYIHANVKADLGNINSISAVKHDGFMVLDATAIRNLELLKNMRDGTKQGTLLAVLDHTKTAMGARKLRSWIENPLLDLNKIRLRQEAIGCFLENVTTREGLLETLAPVNDLERILSRIEVGSANARDLASLRTSLRMLPDIKKLLVGVNSRLLQQLDAKVSLHEELLSLLEAAIVDEPPFSVREGGMIRTGFDMELDELRVLSSDSKTWMRDFEQKVKEECGIKNLKVGFNKIFGYYIEVSKGQADLVPANFVRKQTLVNAERFTVPELKEYENKILSAKERIESLEYYLFNKIREEIRSKLVSIQQTARGIGEIDVLLSLAVAAFRYKYNCPKLNDREEITIKDGRHPVVERLLTKELFVPNDVLLNNEEQRMIILTGPNMAGKSTYMRQVALLVLLTQMGSFIPAASADICPVDRIFTRVGASDDLATGQSTFMVEMNEVAQILHYATKRSLIILDEVGRGTSTFDGMSIARAVMEFIHNKIKAKTLFATHYHQLIELENLLPGVKNYSIAVKERGNEVVFLRRIIAGGTDRSYGIHVAELAGLPKKVTARAEELLTEYDKEQITAKKVLPIPQQEEMPSLFGNRLQQRLLELDVMTMTPLEALNELYKLQEEAREGEGRD